MSANITIMHELCLSDSTAVMEGFDFHKAKSLTEKVSEEEQEKRKRHAKIKISHYLSRCLHPACGHFITNSFILSHFITQHRVGERYQLDELFESQCIAMSASLKTLLHSKKRNIVIANFVYAGPKESSEFLPANRGICLENAFLRPSFNRYKSHLPILVLGRFTTLAKCPSVPVEGAQEPDTLILWCVTVETTKPMFCYMAVYDSKKKRIAAALTGVRKSRKSQDPTKFFKKSSNYLQLSKEALKGIDDNFFLTVTILEYEDTSGYDEESGLEDEDQNNVNDNDLAESHKEEIESPMVEELKEGSGLEIPDLVPTKKYSTNLITHAEHEDKKKNMSWVKGKSETSGNTSTDTCSIETSLLLASDDESPYVEQQLNICLQSAETVPKMNAHARSVSSKETTSSKSTPSDTPSIETPTLETSDEESAEESVNSKDTIPSEDSSFDTCSRKTIISEMSEEKSTYSEESSKIVYDDTDDMTDDMSDENAKVDVSDDSSNDSYASAKTSVSQITPPTSIDALVSSQNATYSEGTAYPASSKESSMQESHRSRDAHKLNKEKLQNGNDSSSEGEFDIKSLKLHLEEESLKKLQVKLMTEAMALKPFEDMVEEAEKCN